MKLQPPPGVQDFLFDECKKFDYIVSIIEEVAQYYCFDHARLPIFEHTEIFNRAIGEASDVVSKEMYTFEDKGERSMTLRPEFTAQIARAFISNGLKQKVPLRLYTHGPLFRYERPQKGRYRQFHQLNFEVIGVHDAYVDAEAICAARDLLVRVGILDKVKLHVNSLGDDETYKNYRISLVEYFKKYENDLSEESRERLAKNPMRILDSKDESDKRIALGAPLLSDCYTKESKEFFDNMCRFLNDLNIAYKVDNKLVRGLDYYCHTVFEFKTDKLGAQDAIMGGGRYNNLISSMEGKSDDANIMPAIGFAGGIERIMLLLDDEKIYKSDNIAALLITSDTHEVKSYALKISKRLRDSNINVLSIAGSMSKTMKKADKIDARFALILGGSEFEKQIITLRDMRDGAQQECSIDDIIKHLQNNA